MQDPRAADLQNPSGWTRTACPSRRKAAPGGVEAGQGPPGHGRRPGRTGEGRGQGNGAPSVEQTPPAPQPSRPLVAMERAWRVKQRQGVAWGPPVVSLGAWDSPSVPLWSAKAMGGLFRDLGVCNEISNLFSDMTVARDMKASGVGKCSVSTMHVEGPFSAARRS